MRGVTYWVVYEWKLLPTLQILTQRLPVLFSLLPGQLLEECRHFFKYYFKTSDYDLSVAVGSRVQTKFMQFLKFGQLFITFSR
jgi:hypothetical protein